MNEIKINHELAALIPPLSEDERELLSESLLNEGCREPLMVWNNTLIDGHNRFQICQDFKIPFDVQNKEFDSIDDAKEWMIRNQLGRRNLTPLAASDLRGQLYNQRKKQGRRTNLTSHQNEEKLTTAEEIAQETGVSKATVERDGQFSSALDALDIRQEVLSGETSAAKQDIIDAAKSLPECPTDEQKEEARKHVHVSKNSGENEWYTPLEFITAAKETMGSIDVDPASNPVANEKIGAAVFFTAEDSGLEKEWVGNIWMNPPYAQPLIAQFAGKILEEISRDPERAGIVLVNNATETQWFQKLLTAAEAVCFPRGRIKFWHPERTAAPLQGQALLYFGEQRHLFYNAFVKFGPVLWKP